MLFEPRGLAEIPEVGRKVPPHKKPVNVILCLPCHSNDVKWRRCLAHYVPIRPGTHDMSGCNTHNYGRVKLRTGNYVEKVPYLGAIVWCLPSLLCKVTLASLGQLIFKTECVKWSLLKAGSWWRYRFRFNTLSRCSIISALRHTVKATPKWTIVGKIFCVKICGYA